MEMNYLDYPRTHEFEYEANALAYLSSSLKMIMQGITSSKDPIKVASIGQTIIQVSFSVMYIPKNT